MEVWLPSEGWNGKYQAVGNGAFTGSIRHNSMAAAVARGYASSSTDTGHVGNTASFGLGHPEKVIDFGYRSLHEMTVFAKQAIETHYGDAPRYSYWVGCSAGGRQAMKAAQRFPEDFDGIIAGAPGLDWTGRAGGSLRVAKPLEADEAMQLPAAARQLVHDAVLAACDATDGVSDGVVGDPERCDFDPGVLACDGNGGDGCLSAAQVRAVRMLYASPENPKTGRPITGLLPGSELGWTDLGWTRSARATGLEQFRYLTFADPEWTIDRFNFETDIVLAEERDDDTLNALDPNLKPFFDRGGKLLSYHGWARPADLPRQRHAVLRARRRHDWQPRGGPRLLPPLHGAGDGPLRRRRRTEPLRHAVGPRAVGRGGRGARPHHCLPRAGRRGRSHPAALRLPGAGGLHRQRQHGRRRELRLSGAVGAAARRATSSKPARPAAPTWTGAGGGRRPMAAESGGAR